MIAGCLGRLGEEQSVADLVIGIPQGDGRLVRRAGCVHTQQPVGLVVGHGQHAIRIGDAGQVPDLVIEGGGVRIARASQPRLVRVYGN